MKTIPIITLLILAVGAPAVAQDDSGNLSEADRAFLRSAAEGNLAEIELGNLAGEKGEAAEVKSFGEKMVEHHGEAQRELQSIAQKHQVNLPDQPNRKHQNLKEKLSKAEGSDFDRRYSKEMLKAHRKDVSDYEKGLERVENEELKQYIEKTLPALRQHLEEVQKLPGNA